MIEATRVAGDTRPTLIRVKHGRDRWWVIFDLVGAMRGRVGESCDSVISRWQGRRRPPAEGYARIPGLLSPVQAGMEVGLFWRDAAKEVITS